MSLDVYLTMPDVQNITGSHIYIREDGQTKELSLDEWHQRYPDREPVVVEVDSSSNEVYSANITHNLYKMADAAGIYECMWRPDEMGIAKATQLIEPLENGLNMLKSDSVRFKSFNPKNGWGNYDGLVEFVENYLDACKRYPDADVSVSR